MRRYRASLCSALLLAGPALAADDPVPRIAVTGTGSVSTVPDRAIVTFSVHGEGATSDEAVSALLARRKAIDGGLASLSARAEAGATQVSIQQVRGRDCNRDGYGAPRLSVADCAIIGYTADLTMEVRTSAVTEAGTMVALVGRLGATNPRLDRFLLADPTDAERRATMAALADAKRQAEAIAQGTGVRLGRLLSAGNTNFGNRYDDIMVTAQRVSAPPPPPPPPPPIAIDLKPRPIETQVRVQVVYAIAPYAALTQQALPPPSP